MSIVNASDRLPPGPQSPLDLESGDDKLQRIHALWQRYGDCYRVRAASRPADTWVVTDPDAVRRVLVSNHRNYTKGVGIERVRVLLGNGLMASEGDQWRRQRRLLQSAFHRPAVETFFPIYHQQATALADRWLQAAHAGQPVNVTEAVSETTLMAVLGALFSQDLDRVVEGDGRSPFQMVSEQRQRDLQFAVRFRALAGPIREIIAARRREQRFPADLLSHCLLARDRSSGEPMNDKQLIDEILTLIVAGHETTAASLNWVWYLLAAHPESFQQLSDAAQQVAADVVPSWDTLEKLQPVAQVIQEALRLYPPGWLYTRRSLRGDRLAGYELPAGTDVFICSWLLHRHPAYWDRPDEFRPARFSREQQAQRHRYVYLPFSAGPRHCIGESFAMAEMMIHLAVLAARLRPQPVASQPVELEADVNLRPRAPLYLRFTPVGCPGA
ncbi:MAG: cytochrome P450 [Thiogranum sp.]|jgi:cytochrome P450